MFYDPCLPVTDAYIRSAHIYKKYLSGYVYFARAFYWYGTGWYRCPLSRVEGVAALVFSIGKYVLVCDVHGGKVKCFLLDDIFSGFYLSL